MDYALRTHQLSKTYANGVIALKGVDLAIAQSVDFLLAIEDHELRAKGMDVIVYSDELCRPTQWGHCGSLSVNTTVANAFTDDGFWKESTVYQMIATGRVIGLLRSLDRAGYQPWEANGRVFRSACAPFRPVMCRTISRNLAASTGALSLPPRGFSTGRKFLMETRDLAVKL